MKRDELKDVISQLQVDPVLLTNADDGSIICMSPVFKELYSSMTLDEREMLSKRCRGDGEESWVIANPVSSENFSKTRPQLILNSHPIPWDTSLRLVIADRDVPYDSLLERYEVIKYTIETLGRGLGLLLIRAPTRQSIFEYATENFSQLVGVPIYGLKSYGMTDILERIHPADVSEFSERIFSGECGEWVQPFRLDFEGQYKWLRFVGNTLPRKDEVLRCAIICEEYPEGESKELDNDKSPNFMLSSFINAVFDASMYVDDQFRVGEDSKKLRFVFFGDSDVEESVKGRTLESFMPIAEDRMRFREYLVKPLESQAQITDPEAGPLPAAPTLRLHMSLGGGELRDVQLYASPTYFKAIEKLESPYDNVPMMVVGNATMQSDSVYLVGIRFMVSSDVPVQQPVYVETPPVRPPPSKSRRSSVAPELVLTGVPEESECSESAVSATCSIARGIVAGTTMSAQRRGLIAHAHQRFLSRDLLQALEDLDDDVTDNLPSTKIGTKPKTGLLAPLYQVSDFEVMEEEVIRCLPNTLQGEFIKSRRRGDFTRCASLLSHSIEGYANILSPPRSAPPELVDNTDLVHCIFRLFLGMAGSADVDSCCDLIISLEASLKGISKAMGNSGTEVASLELTLTLVSAGIRYPERFTSVESMQWLRQGFADAMKTTHLKKAEMSRRLPSMYYLCALWASLMHVLHRADEAKALLENISEDMNTYCARHPESTAARKLQAVSVHNLAVIALQSDDLYRALSLVHRLQGILAISHVTFPRRCYDLVSWAVYAQAEAEQKQARGG